MTERQALLLINPNSRSGAGGAEALTTRLRQGGLGVIQVAPNGPDNIAAAIREHRQRIDRVIVGGGDGTVNAALPGVAASGLPMGVLPLGTANDFARSLGVPLEPLAACDVIAADPSKVSQWVAPTQATDAASGLAAGLEGLRLKAVGANREYVLTPLNRLVLENYTVYFNVSMSG